MVSFAPHPDLGVQVQALDPSTIQPAVFHLTEAPCLIGRDQTCHIIVHRTAVSRNHARIEFNGQRFVLYDNNSTNGTFVNHRRLVEPHILQTQDVIGLGATTSILSFVDPNATFKPTAILRYDDRYLTFYFKNQPLELTPTQFRLMHHLYQHAGEWCSHESCAEAIWGRDYTPDLYAAALHQAMATLRYKVRMIDEAFELVRTRRGVGYLLSL